MRHLAMMSTETTAGTGARTYEVVPSDGEQFLMWAPELVDISPDDDLKATASWNLVGIDEGTFVH